MTHDDFCGWHLNKRESDCTCRTSESAALVDEREKTHGPFEVTAAIYCELCLAGSKHTSFPISDWTAVQWTALDMIMMKIARIYAGNANDIDHWRDIAGYAELVVRSLEKRP